jgi:FKBP-type peptidyl-prolyl cis-trans isomerase
MEYNMIKTLARPLLASLTMAILASCSSTPQVCTKPGAALNQINEQLFFIKNAKQQGVEKSTLGYQYKIVHQGKGTQHPESADTVLVNYVTRRLDGTVIDSGNRTALPVSKVIEGWKLALSEMVVGDTRLIYVPAKLAYGCKSQPSNSGYDEALMFDLELLKIQ